MKKRLTALLLFFALILTVIFSLSSCGEKYKPVESTAEEKRTAMKISYDGEKYEVPYELYRAFFLQLKSSVDNGNEEVWTGADKEKYEKAVDELIWQRISEIYAVFHLCEKADIDVYSKDFNENIKKIIEVSIEGGSFNGTDYKGFGGDYDKYLASLKKMNLNYSAQTLLIRYQLAYEALTAYYIGGFENSIVGAIEYTKEDVEAFYTNEEESRRVILAQLDRDYFTEKRANQIRETIASKTDAKDVANYVAGFTLSSPTSESIGRFTYDGFYYSKLTDSVFSLGIGETGEVISLKTDVFDGYVIVYRLEATDEFFESNYDEIALSYLYNEIGKTLSSVREDISKAISPTDVIKNLDRSRVTME